VNRKADLSAEPTVSRCIAAEEDEELSLEDALEIWIGYARTASWSRSLAPRRIK